MKQNNFQVYNSQGMGGPAPASKAPRGKPLPFRRDGFVGQRLSLEDAIRIPDTQKVKLEIELKWLKTIFSFLQNTTLLPKIKLPKVTLPKIPTAKIEHAIKTLFTPVVVVYKFVTKSVEWVQKKVEIAKNIAVKFAVMVGQAIMRPVHKYIFTPIDRTYNFVASKVETFAKWAEKKIEAVQTRVIETAERVFAPIQKFVARTYEALEKPAEAVKNALVKTKEFVEEKVQEFFAPITHFFQQIPDQVAMASLWMLQTRPVQFVKRSTLRIVSMVKWCQHQGKRGGAYLVKLAKKPLKLIQKTAQAIQTAFLSVVDSIIAWITKMIKRVYNASMLILNALYHFLLRTPTYALRFGKFLLRRFARLTVWLNAQMNN